MPPHRSNAAPGTLGYLIDGRYWMVIHCETCGRHADLDLRKVAAVLGRNHSYLAGDLHPKLKCSVCGAKRIGGVIGSGHAVSGRRAR